MNFHASNFVASSAADAHAAQMERLHSLASQAVEEDEQSWRQLQAWMGEQLHVLSAESLQAFLHCWRALVDGQPQGWALVHVVEHALSEHCDVAVTSPGMGHVGATDARSQRVTELLALPVEVYSSAPAWALELTATFLAKMCSLLKSRGLIPADAEIHVLPRILSANQADSLDHHTRQALVLALARRQVEAAEKVFNAKAAECESSTWVFRAEPRTSHGVLTLAVTKTTSKDQPTQREQPASERKAALRDIAKELRSTLGAKNMSFLADLVPWLHGVLAVAPLKRQALSPLVRAHGGLAPGCFEGGTRGDGPFGLFDDENARLGLRCVLAWPAPAREAPGSA